jgi:crossover junction endodeoxyribonuclease RuvC
MATVILGLDPGSIRSGYAVVGFERDRVISLHLGVWTVPIGQPRAASLAWLRGRLDECLTKHRCDAAAVETPFQHRNARSALVLAEARGALLSGLGAAEVPVFEYPPAMVKKTICGSGAAEKTQLRRVLGRTVPGLSAYRIDDAPLDATDALALAVAHFAHSRVDRVVRTS